MKEETTIRWKDYRIVIDEWNWSLYTVREILKGKNKGKEAMVTRGHFSSPERLILHMAKLETLRELDASDFDTFLTRFHENTKTVLAHVPLWSD